jgi:nucleoside-triphosphatase THEP1
VRGLLAPAVNCENGRSGYDLIDIASGNRSGFLRLAAHPGKCGEAVIGNYRLVPGSLEFGFRALEPGPPEAPAPVFLDEVGPWELAGGGWAPAISRLLARDKGLMIWVVRSGLLENVVRCWNLGNPELIDIAGLDAERLRLRVQERVRELQE